MSEEVVSSTHVLTSENAADFYAQKLNLAAEPAVVADVEADAPSEPIAEESVSESEEKQEEAKATEERKPNPKIEKRFSELTKQRELARKEAEAERVKREELENRLKALETQAAPKKVAESDPEPQRDQFANPIEYAKALAEWTAEKAIQDFKRQEAEAKAAQEREKLLQAWNTKQQQAIAELPDYEEMVASSQAQVSDAVKDAILESDFGPQILYHLAANDELASKFESMSDAKALREIGKLEAMFETKPEKSETKPEVKTVAEKSKAPAPISPLKATSAATDVRVGSDGQYHGTYAQWKADRKAGRIR